MRRLSLDGLGSVLLLGAHSDDIEIGCGGTVLRLIEQNPSVTVHWIVFSGRVERVNEAERSAARFLAGTKAPTVEVHQFRDGFFPSEQARIKTYFEELKTRLDPDLVFTHYRDDLGPPRHLELTWNTYRGAMRVKFKWDGDAVASASLPLSAAPAQRKVQI
jgi:LmbE family N-acetylglucosaminyl deacetylase